LLLHEFHKLKYIKPEKKRPGKKGPASKSKAKYSGGLVLEPKRGLYDSFILLLDFNSLYPSIIQEYNLCFTTINDWSKFAAPAKDDDEQADSAKLPAIPESSTDVGVLPRVIKGLVERRRAVKGLLKKEANTEKKAELDIRQKALKLTANSMYGCLGFSNSRFFAQPIAALVTSMGRETLQRTVDIAQNSVGLDVIYGDTDSIMINTRVNDESDIAQVNRLGEKVKKEVNKLYRTLELEIDGIFRSMLLLKKKKYAARTVEQVKDGKIVKYGHELKGLDLVRRDWCVQSKETGRYVTEQIISGQDSETVVSNIYNHLEYVATRMRNGELDLEKYTITKGLSKHPKDYPDAKSQPHVQVAISMISNNRHVNTGDHIPYIITAPPETGENSGPRNIKKESSAADRARHPDEVLRSNGALKPDVMWYLTQQILPPISRLCEPIEAISPKFLAEKLGLDSSSVQNRSTMEGGEEELLIDYKPASLDSDEQRFKDVEKLKMRCFSCNTEQEFPGVARIVSDGSGSQSIMSGLCCTNKNCLNPALWGSTNHFECFSRIENTSSIWVHNLMSRYYEGNLKCNDPSCGLVTRQVSVAGGVCLRTGCTGRLVPYEAERDVQVHLKYLETLFNMKHAEGQLQKKMSVDDRKLDLSRQILSHDRTVFGALHKSAQRVLDSNSFNFISSSFWNGLFNKSKKSKQ